MKDKGLTQAEITAHEEAIKVARKIAQGGIV